MSSGIRVHSSLTIPASELEVRFSASGGPGGQHANKVATRVDLSWNVRDSQVLGPRQRSQILSRLGHRIDGAGNLRLSSDGYRSQLRNREEVSQRLASLVAEALRPRKSRRATAPTKASKERRLQDKRKRSETKKARQSPPEE